MLLTVIDIVILQELLTTSDTPIIRNLSLILALILKFISAVDRGDYCPSNKNGWAWVVLCLAEQHQIENKGFDGTENIVKAIRDKGTELAAKRDRERCNWWLKGQCGPEAIRLPTEEEIESCAASERYPPCY